MIFRDDHMEVLGIHGTFVGHGAGLAVVCLNRDWLPKPGVRLECMTASGIRLGISNEMGCAPLGLTNEAHWVQINRALRVDNPGFDCILVAGDY